MGGGWCVWWCEGELGDASLAPTRQLTLPCKGHGLTGWGVLQIPSVVTSAIRLQTLVNIARYAKLTSYDSRPKGASLKQASRSMLEQQ